jgi:CubicO group peptidase (beta-lactamase class C family)
MRRIGATRFAILFERASPARSKPSRMCQTARRSSTRRRAPTAAAHTGSLVAGIAMLALACPANAQTKDEIEEALGSTSAAQREWALDQIIESRGPFETFVEDIVRLLDDADQAVAGKAAVALSLCGPDAFERIEELLQDGSAQQRWGATIALWRTSANIDRFAPALTTQLVSDDEQLVRASLAALSRLQSRAAPALPALTRLLKHEESEIRWAALSTLAAIGPPARAALPQIMPFLEDESSELRLAAAAAVISIQPPAPLAPQQLATHIAWLEDRIPRLMQEHRVPGVSIAVIQQRRLYWAKPWGVRDARTQEPVTLDTVFEAASMSKPIMTLSTLQLIRQGRLDLDVPLTRYLGHDYLPDLSGQERITARMALTHRTGLPNWRIGYDEMGGPVPLLFAPGSDYLYSGEGILFLQRAMEAITATPLERYAETELFSPLGLTRTSFVWTEAIEKDLASGHRDDGTFEQRTRYRKANGAYTLYTTPSEYARLMLAVMSPEILGERAFDATSIELLLQRQQRLPDGDPWVRPRLARSIASYRALGWSLEVTAEGDIFQHSGSNSSGFKAFAQFNPLKGSGFAIFMNGEGGAALRDAVLAEMGDL